VKKPKSKPYAIEPLEPTRVADARVAAEKRTPTAQYLYRAPLRRFLEDVDHKRLTKALTSKFETLEGQSPGEKEVTSWERSLPALAEVLRDERLARSEIFVELWMPIGSYRCDAVLTGKRFDDKPTAIVVELKQWTHVAKSKYHNEVWVQNDSKLHPSVQVAGYVGALKHSNSAFVEEGVQVGGCVWLHGLQDRKCAQMLRDQDAFGLDVTEFPIFVKGEERTFAGWLDDNLGHGAGTEAAEKIARGKRMPSPKLLDLVVQTVRNEHAWRLVGRQMVVFNRIVQSVEHAQKAAGHTVVLVQGAPGTGKSVIAIQLLAYGAKQGWKVLHATGSQAFQTNLKGKTIKFADDLHTKMQGTKKKKDLPVRDMFCTFADVAKAGSKGVTSQDLVVADEAHRLWEHRRIKYPNGMTKNLTDTPMIEEVIKATRVSAFFLDDNQAVRAGEIGHSKVIHDAALRMGAALIETSLDAQFRCNGSASYVRWVDALLGFGATNDLGWQRAEEYDLRLEENVEHMDKWLRMKIKTGAKCRIVAGYCWRWSKPGAGNKLVSDVTDKRFGTWKAPWIEKTGQGRQPLDNQYYRWANEDDYYAQVGSIYSVQGFEFDHVGVIWGEDLVWRTDHWEADLTKNQDKTFKRDIRQAEAAGEKDAAVTKLRNVYRVLLTRGMQGTSLFVLDAETRAKVHSMLSAQRVAVSA
jgi:uncharacterized protein